MLAFEKFEKLAQGEVAQRPVEMALVGKQGEHLSAWQDALIHLDRYEQHRQLTVVLGEMVVADIKDELRYQILDKTLTMVERLVARLHSDYIYSPQSPALEQRSSVQEVRSLYFLLILAYQGIAYRAYEKIGHDGIGQEEHQSTKPHWFKRLVGALPSNVVRNGMTLDLMNPSKRLFALSVYRIMGVYFKLLLEFALTYQKTPRSLWGRMNDWYLKSVMIGVENVHVSQLGDDLAHYSIHHQYVQSCLASFANLFAYRREDILNIFKLLPTWAKRTRTTFVPHERLKVFVNLQAATPPELITPYASINPYADNQVCLFFDTTELFHHLHKLQDIGKKQSDGGSFESRLAKMVLLSFERKFDSSASIGGTSEYLAQMQTGFSAIFNRLADDKSFAQLIHQAHLPSIYHPKIKQGGSRVPDEKVRVLTKSDLNVHFICGELRETLAEPAPTRPYLPVFGLFALRSHQSTNKHPWRLGIVHWAEPRNDQVAVDGRFLGRVLSVCGVRLMNQDMRSQDFVQALLVAGDGLGQQTTLVMPRYHFKEGDMVMLRIDDKESMLRLEQNLLSTDDVEQYQIVRLVVS
ncbi:MAG: hypothetical protein Q4C68_00695 [Moraxella sp.]|nr:hypothetical protein [Moraxella sp.]